MTNPAMVLKLIVAAFAVTIAFHPGLEANAADQSAAKTPDPKHIVVEIRKLKFLPEVLAISPGDVVVWKNLDIVPHTVTAEDGSWDSELIEAGAQWETVITAEMIEAYYCQYHPAMIAKLDIERP